MPSNYSALQHDQQRILKTITNSGRLIAGLYADRTHFIYELLQNAEDALARRADWEGSRAVLFTFADESLRVSHWGKPFDERDVEGICSIGESTKDLTDIGRFGIGFKSVYAFTDRPEIHSGSEDFAIENFVFPVSAGSVDRHGDQTVIVLPLRTHNSEDRSVIAEGFKNLGPGALLFLKQIEEISWTLGKNSSGLYLRSRPEVLGGDVNEITVVGQESDGTSVEQDWLVFTKPVRTDPDYVVGSVEIGFRVTAEDEGTQQIQPIKFSPLVVFFPTALETHLGFLAQGPYRTTPSRDNVPSSDTWNQRLVRETATLLTDSLRWLRDHEMLDAEVLRCLPLDPIRFANGTMFAPLFEETRKVLLDEPLIPKADGGYIAGRHAALARTQELRGLLSVVQLTQLLGRTEQVHWVTGEITHDRTPELRDYLKGQLNVPELTPDAMILRLSKSFLEPQTDDWILSLYEFLKDQPGLRYRFQELPLVRLIDGSHVKPFVNNQPQAYLPSDTVTSFPIVRAAVCATEAAHEFLEKLGLTKPDAVDEVLWNVLPKYRSPITVSNDEYATDIGKILRAFETDSKEQRDKLIAALRTAPYVRSVDAGSGQKKWAPPGITCLATDRLKQLFAGVKDVYLVDTSFQCLSGEKVRELLEATGSVRHLRTLSDHSLSWEQRTRLREEAGHPDTSGQKDRVDDWRLAGLTELLAILSDLPPNDRAHRAALLWEELANLEDRRGKGVFEGHYSWSHYGDYRKTFNSAFVRQLNDSNWVPNPKGELERPIVVLFDSLGWKPNPFLQSKIRFRPVNIDRLAEEAGIEPQLLDLLKRLGLTTAEKLKSRLQLDDPPTPAGETVNTIPGSDRTDEREGQNLEKTRAEADTDSDSPKTGGPRIESGSKQTKASFVSYISIEPVENDEDPDGLDHERRMDLEETAIRLILSLEPRLRRTPTHNPGFDLWEADDAGQPTKWVEVKAMKGTLEDRPVGMSAKQFEMAQLNGDRYWLYVVESTPSAGARVLAIQNPAGRGSTFTFDSGWVSVAAELKEKSTDGNNRSSD